MKKVLLFALLITISACAYVDPSITDQTKVYYDSPVNKSTLQVSVYPKGKQYRPLTAYFHPFVIQQENSDYMHLSSSFAAIFHGAWAEERLFPIMEFQPGTPYRGLNSALEKARRRGADLLVLGVVPYFYAGHTVDDTAITIQINIYSAGNGNLLWTMMQSGRIEDKLPDDYIYFRHEFRLSEGPFNKIIRDIAKDMTIPLKSWLPSPDTDYQFASNARDVEANLIQAPATTDTGGTSSDGAEGKDIPEATDTNSMMKKDAPKGIRPDEDGILRPQVNGVNLNIEFDFDKATIQKKSYDLLDALGEALNSDDLKGKSIIIGGHTDAKGTDQYNLSLSKQRAQSVKTYLVNKWGIDPELIEAVGYGKSRPLNDGMTTEEQQKNRRVEIRLVQ